MSGGWCRGRWLLGREAAEGRDQFKRGGRCGFVLRCYSAAIARGVTAP
jgi:hypothetical protein